MTETPCPLCRGLRRGSLVQPTRDGGMRIVAVDVACPRCGEADEERKEKDE